MAKKKRISPVDLTGTIAQILKEYGTEVDAVLEDAVIDTAAEAVHQLRAVNRFSPGGNPSGAYSASWTLEPVRGARFGSYWVVFNENHYQLPHLLEYGHAKQNGGRAPAYSHIAKVNDDVNKLLLENFVKRINR